MKLSDIDASLEYGWRDYPKGIKILLYISFICAMLDPIISTIYIVIGKIRGLQMTEILENTEDIIVLLVTNAVSIICLFIVGTLFLQKILLKKRMKMWMRDVIELHAYTRRLDVRGIIRKSTKIEVKFCLHKEWHVQSSGKGKWYRAIYSTAFTKYADRKINILYSPKYDQVMILKDK